MQRIRPSRSAQRKTSASWRMVRATVGGRWANAVRFIPIFPSVLLTTALLGCRVEIEPRHDGYSSAGPNGTVTRVDYGYSGERVYFVTFQTEQGELIPHAKVTLLPQPDGHNDCKGYITLPDRTQQDLPTSHRIFEITHGQFHSARIRFTASQLRSYLKSHPMPPTIDGLEQFIKGSK